MALIDLFLLEESTNYLGKLLKSKVISLLNAVKKNQAHYVAKISRECAWKKGCSISWLLEKLRYACWTHIQDFQTKDQQKEQENLFPRMRILHDFLSLSFHDH